MDPVHRLVSFAHRPWVCALVALAVAAALTRPLHGQTFVDIQAVDGAGTGTSWSDAFTNLQDAIASTNPGKPIWVARGTYYPDIGMRQTPGDREATFLLPAEVEILGGFNGTETLVTQRDPDLNVTILSGDLAGNDVGDPGDASRMENSLHIVTAFDVPDTTLLDGFTITGGNANLDGNSGGGGLLNVNAAPTINDCRFIANQAEVGGAIFNITSGDAIISACDFTGNRANQGGAIHNGIDCNPQISRCTFSGNEAINEGLGGAMYTGEGFMSLRDCTFTNNIAVRGGAMYNDAFAQAITVRCTFQNNFATERGGGVYTTSNMGPFVNCQFITNSADRGGGFAGADSTELLVTNCAFRGNEATHGAAVALDNSDPCLVGNTIYGNSASFSAGGVFIENGGSPNITNSIVWGNTDGGGDGNSAQIRIDTGSAFVTYSLIRGGWSGAGGTGVIDANPLFRDAALGDLRLLGGSAAIDAGSNSAVPGDGGDIDDDGNVFEVTPIDLGGRPRTVNDVATPDTGQGAPPLVDLGAYEFGRRVFVQQGGPGMSLGISWSDPYQTMVEALNNAAASGGAVSEIWVAEGTYKTVTFGTNRFATLQLVDGAAVYGGFAGGETFLSERDPANRETILTGDLLGDDGPFFSNYADNSLHVVTGSGTDASVILDGFTIIGGNANLGGLDSRGAGVHIDGGSPTITGCLIQWNTSENNGAGVWNDNGGSPTITDCVVENNRVTTFGGGGGLYSGAGSPRVTRCTFFANMASLSGGGVLMGGSLASSPVFTSCRFIGNQAATGGGLRLDGTFTKLINCVLSGNDADLGGGIYTSGAAQTDLINSTLANNDANADDGGGIHVTGSAAVAIRNTILWHNAGMRGGNESESGQLFVESGSASVNYSLIQNLTGGLGGAGNAAGDPAFTDETGDDGSAGTLDDDLSIVGGSAAIDAGDTPAVPADVDDLDGDGDTTERLPLDLAGDPRVIDDLATPDTGIPGSPVVDMGGYEFEGGVLDCNDNGVADDIDISMGTSLDCNANAIPDECDIADCDAGALPDCDDCNLNGVPDSCDIAAATSIDADMDGVPDECAQFTGLCPGGSIDWSCVGNWDLGGVFPDNDGGTTYNVTLDNGDHVFLDVTVDIDTLRVQDSSRLDVTASGSVGDLTVVQPNGVLIESLVQVADERMVDVTLGDVFIRDGGTYQADPLATDGSVAARLMAPRIVVQDGGKILLIDSMQLHVAGDLILEDLPDGDPCPNCGGQTPPVTGGSGSSQILIEGNLEMNEDADLNFDSTGNFELRGDFLNFLTEPAGFEFSHGRLVLSGLAQTYEVGGDDVGASLAGFLQGNNTNFSMGTIEVFDAPFVPYEVTFNDTFDNIPGAGPCTEALYVHTLIIHPGVNILIDDVTIYYETLVNQGNIDDTTGCGAVLALPACGSDGDCDDGNDCFVDACDKTAGTCSYEFTLAGCADSDGDLMRDDPCRWYSCDNETCSSIEIVYGDMGGPFGQCEPDGAADGNDRFHALNCFANVAPGNSKGTYPCELAPPHALNVDAAGRFGACEGDGTCDGNDAFAALNAFDNSATCSCPSGGPAPGAPAPTTVAHAGLALRATHARLAPGDRVEVDVLLTTPLKDLRGYQLHLATTGGASGSLDLVDISIADTAPSTGKTRRRPHPRRHSRPVDIAEWSAFNIDTGQMVAGTDAPGRGVEPGTLATFTFRASPDARGRFAIEALADVHDPGQRTFLFPSRTWNRIVVPAVEPLTLVVTP